MALENQKTEAEAIAKLALDGQAPHTFAVADGVGVIALRDQQGARLVSIKPFIDEYRTTPERRQGTATLGDLASFEAFTNRFKDRDSAVFARREPPSMTVVLDYNQAGPDNTKARFGKHRGVYSFPLSKEWEAWTAATGKQMNQAEFAAFIEDRIADVSDPSNPGTAAIEFSAKLGAKFASPSKLLALSKGLEVRQKAIVKNVVSLDSGEVQLNYVTENTDTAGQPLTVPTAFLLNIPVFRSGVTWEVAVRLRHRVGSGSITWFFELYRTDKIFDAAFNEAIEHVKTATELPLFVGAPE